MLLRLNMDDQSRHEALDRVAERGAEALIRLLGVGFGMKTQALLGAQRRDYSPPRWGGAH